MRARWWRTPRRWPRRCKSEGLDIVSGGTDNHLMLVDLRPKKATGKCRREGARPRLHHLQQERDSLRPGKAGHHVGHPARHAGRHHARLRHGRIPRDRQADRRSGRRPCRQEWRRRRSGRRSERARTRARAVPAAFPIYPIERGQRHALPLLRTRRHPGEGQPSAARTIRRSAAAAIVPACGGRFTTFERVQLRELIVVKKNGRREAFDRDKLERSINHALRKRPVEPERVDRMITGIVRRLESMGENEIPVDSDRRAGDAGAGEPRQGRLCALRLGLQEFPRGQGFREPSIGETLRRRARRIRTLS